MTNELYLYDNFRQKLHLMIRNNLSREVLLPTMLN